jgi:hypothetical protein
MRRLLGAFLTARLTNRRDKLGDGDEEVQCEGQRASQARDSESSYSGPETDLLYTV